MSDYVLKSADFEHVLNVAWESRNCNWFYTFSFFHTTLNILEEWKGVGYSTAGMKAWRVISGVLMAAVLIGLTWLFWPSGGEENLAPARLVESTAEVVEVSPVQTPGLVAPVEGFRERITKKPFGIYITPQTSPTQPERFSGYHTGVDVEYDSDLGDVSVRAVADGTVVLARTVSGYGGVVAIQHVIAGQRAMGVYGHLRPSSLPRVGTAVAAGQRIGVLGSGGTAETDGERRHLHFGLVKGAVADLRGYVAKESELAGWLNPLAVGW